MNEISSVTYKEISDLYADAYNNLVLAQNLLIDSIEYAAVNLAVEPKIDLLKPLYDAKVRYENLNLHKTLLAAVSALNVHIQNRSGQTLNDWLTENNIRVSVSWAYLSEMTGFIIDKQNVED